MKSSIRPVWDEIEGIRRKTESFLREQGVSEDTLNSVVMVSSELTENAVKYGSYRPDDMLCVSITCGHRLITVEVLHPLRANDPASLRRLDEQVQWIRSYQNPFEAYLEKLKEVSSRGLGDGESGLGLVRIAYEGQSLVDFYVDDEERLCVSAVHTVS